MRLPSLFLTLSFFFGLGSLVAQSSTNARGMAVTPTTKVLAIGHLTEAPSPELRQMMSREVPATVQLFLQGKIEQWYSRKDMNGVVFVLNVSSVEEAHALLEKLPLGVAKKMQFDLIPLGPLAPLSLLLPANSSTEPR